MKSKVKNGKKVATPELTMRDRVFQLHDKGMSSKQIGRQLDVPPTTIAAYLAHRTRGAKPTTLRDQVFQLCDQGLSSEEVGRQLGVSPTTIAAYLAHRTRGTYA